MQYKSKHTYVEYTVSNRERKREKERENVRGAHRDAFANERGIIRILDIAKSYARFVYITYNYNNTYTLSGAARSRFRYDKLEIRSRPLADAGVRSLFPPALVAYGYCSTCTITIKGTTIQHRSWIVIVQVSAIMHF